MTGAQTAGSGFVHLEVGEQEVRWEAAEVGCEGLEEWTIFMLSWTQEPPKELQHLEMQG